MYATKEITQNHTKGLYILIFLKLYDSHVQALIQLLLTSGGAVYRTLLTVQVLELEQYPVDDVVAWHWGRISITGAARSIGMGWII